MSKITQQAFADRIGTSRQAVSDVVAREIVNLDEGFDESLIKYCSHLREVAAGRFAKGESGDLTEERTRLTKWQADKVELEVMQLDGQLIPAEEVAARWGEIVSAVRSKLLALPVKIARVALAAEGLREIEDAIKREIKLAMVDLADHGDIESDSVDDMADI